MPQPLRKSPFGDNLTVDTSGRVLMPNQPSFVAVLTTSVNVTSGGNIPFPDTVYNVGNHYSTSTYRFTAPVAGTYVFIGRAMMAIGTGITVRAFNTLINKNGSDIDVRQIFRTNIGASTYGSVYPSTHGTALVYMQAGDYAQLKTTWEIDGGFSSTQTFHQHGTSFSGYLLK